MAPVPPVDPHPPQPIQVAVTRVLGAMRVDERAEEDVIVERGAANASHRGRFVEAGAPDVEAWWFVGHTWRDLGDVSKVGWDDARVDGGKRMMGCEVLSGALEISTRFFWEEQR
jgi:hypothetical protein